MVQQFPPPNFWAYVKTDVAFEGLKHSLPTFPLLGHETPSKISEEPPWVRARAASIAPKLTTEDHECLVKAFQESISDDLDSMLGMFLGVQPG